MAPTSGLLQRKAALRAPLGALRSPLQPRRLGLDSKLSCGRRGCAEPLGCSGQAGSAGGEEPARQPRSDQPTCAGPSPHSGYCGAAPEGRGLGFGFLLMRLPQGNRGISGNRAGIAEVRAAAAGDGRPSSVEGQWPSGSSKRSWGKPVPEKPHLNAPAPAPKQKGRCGSG